MELEGKHVAILIEDLYEDLEYWYPYYRLKEAGAAVTTLGTGKDLYKGKHGLPAQSDKIVDEVSAEEFDAVVIPGGYSPDKMRRHKALIDFVRQMDEARKPIAFICHAGWVPISADILDGRKATSFYAIHDDMENAGVEWRNEEVVVDGHLISSRDPDDLPAFCQAIIQSLQ